MSDKENKEAFLRYVTRLEAKCDNALKQRDALLDACKAWERAMTKGILKTNDLGTEMLGGEAIEKTKAAIKLCKIGE